MSKSTQLTGSFLCRCLAVWLFASLLSAAAWATRGDALSGKEVAVQTGQFTTQQAIDGLSFPSSAKEKSEDNFADMLLAVEAHPDVAVFSIWVAGPVVAMIRANHANQLAEAQGNIVVIYPDIGEPYRSVFSQIIDGIAEKTQGRATHIAVGSNVNMGELNNALHRQDARVVIALGRQGVRAVAGLDSRIGVVVGGIVSAPENEVRDYQVNSLAPDPALLFARLKHMRPGIKRIFTVYDPRQNAWMMRFAKEAARAQGLELVAREALDLRSAMQAYQEILSSADGNQDALWLPQDSTTVEDGSVLPLVLKESWERNLVVFSSSFAHVKRGVLFSLYPNNIELGRHLADSALGYLNSGGNKNAGMYPLREVLMAVNLRTARHLDINTSRQQGFDIAFPEQ